MVIKEIAKLWKEEKKLGHADITTTLNLYVHPNNAEKKDVLKK